MVIFIKGLNKIRDLLELRVDLVGFNVLPSPGPFITIEDSSRSNAFSSPGAEDTTPLTGTRARTLTITGVFDADSQLNTDSGDVTNFIVFCEDLTASEVSLVGRGHSAISYDGSNTNKSIVGISNLTLEANQ